MVAGSITTPRATMRSNTAWPVGGAPAGANASARTSWDWSIRSWRIESRVRKKLALIRKFPDTTGMPSVALDAHVPVQLALTGRLTKPAAHVPGGFASPWAPGGRLVVQAAPPMQPLVALAGPEVQNARSPCLA